MKRKSIYILCILAMGLVIVSCNNYDWDVDHNTTLTQLSEVSCSEQELTMTVNYKDSIEEDGSHLKKGRTIHFEWETVKAADYSKVFYELQFFTENSDQPFYLYKTSGNQIDTFADITEFQMNDIAERGAIRQKEEANIKWRIRASNGINETFSSFTNLKIKRPDGFARYPSEINILGSAVEGVGNVVFNAPKLRNLKDMHQVGKNKEYWDNGQYDIFTYLPGGEFYLIEKLSGDSIYRRFTISENDELVEVLGNEELKQSKPVKDGLMHRVYANFKTGKAKVVAIENVELWYNGSVNGSLGTMTLSDEKTPVWTLKHYLELSGTAISKYRYKFRMQEIDHKNNKTYQYWGYEALTAVNQSTASLPSYFYLYPSDDTTNYCYKFQDSGQDKKTLQITVDLRGSIDYYTHSIKEAIIN